MKPRSAPGRTIPDAAGIDLGATVHYVAVPADRDENPVRHCKLTEDLADLADWLKAVSHHHRCHGGHRGLLDPAVPNP